MKFIIILCLLTLAGCSSSRAYNQLYAQIEVAVAMREQGVNQLYPLMEQVAQNYLQESKQDELIKILSFYPQIFTYTKSRKSVAMFIPVIKSAQHRNSFVAALQAALPSKAYQEFVRRLNLKTLPSA